MTLGDVTLYPSDIMLLHAPRWFNDSLVTFFLEHLRMTRLGGLLSAPILLVPPSITYFLSVAQSRSDIAAQLEPLCLKSRALVILLVNSASSPTAIAAVPDNAPAGEHWSVLAFDRASSAFFAFDSLEDVPNEPSARSIAKTVIPFLGLERDIHPSFRIARTPMQENAYDCGPFACACVENLVDLHLNGISFGDERHRLNRSYFPKFRRKLKMIIDMYIQKANQNRE